MHQFDKVEMFVYCRPEDAETEHARLLAWEREFVDALEIPYRVIDVATGDLGSSAARKFDMEAWIPTQGTYREITSTSNTTEFQARRLRIRVREGDVRFTFPLRPDVCGRGRSVWYDGNRSNIRIGETVTFVTGFDSQGRQRATNLKRAASALGLGNTLPAIISAAAFMGLGILPRYLSFEPAKDPDEFLRKEGRLALMERLEKAPRFLDFLLEKIIPTPIPETIDRKLQVMKEVFAVLAPRRR